MSSRPLVSILIPAYNAEEWISDTLTSALAQTWRDKEVIVVDDGSSDSTVRVARRFEEQGVIVESQRNSGAASARNHAYSLCRGEYIQWLDADDLLSNDKVASQIGAAGGDPRILLSSGWGYFAYRPSRASFRPTALWRSQNPADWLRNKMAGNLHMQTATWLVSRELTEAAGPWNPDILTDDDGEYFCRVLLASNGVQFVPEGRVFYRINGPGRLSNVARSNKRKDSQFESMRLHVGYLLSLEDSPRSRAACVRYLQNWSIEFYPDRPDVLQRIAALAQELGGTVEEPQLRWKYAWLKPLIGPRRAKMAQSILPGIKSSLLRRWDRALHTLLV
jgi:glycosyltransferase involved in cell wall biosynthesis